ALQPDADEAVVTASIEEIVAAVQSYVPGYRLRVPPQFDETHGVRRVTIMVEVEGAGDFLPPYAGNLDIMTAAAAKVGDELGRELLKQGR
ncbi:MAG TPA: hypothetical protein PLV68_16730, partial [Ilumatobacteraceae bacterium]|nr:hypothetical protein [Ilumatobacteraceae bacterium]